MEFVCSERIFPGLFLDILKLTSLLAKRVSNHFSVVEMVLEKYLHFYEKDQLQNLGS